MRGLAVAAGIGAAAVGAAWLLAATKGSSAIPSPSDIVDAHGTAVQANAGAGGPDPTRMSGGGSQRWPQVETDPFRASLAPPDVPVQEATVQAAVRAEAPTPPPMPLRFMGRVVDAQGKETVFLQAGNELFVAAVGEVIADVYRVDSISPQTIDLTYVPLGVRQSVPLP